MTLKEYYKSKHWRDFRKPILNDIDAHCEICKRKKWTIYKVNTKKHKKGDKRRLLTLSVHHLHYNSLGFETREDVITVCNFCHQLGHDLEKASNMSPIPYKAVYLLFKKLTKWDYHKYEH